MVNRNTLFLLVSWQPIPFFKTPDTVSSVTEGRSNKNIDMLLLYYSPVWCYRVAIDKNLGVAYYTAGIDFGQRDEVLLYPEVFVVVGDIVGKETEVVAYSCSLQYYMRYIYLIEFLLRLWQRGRVGDNVEASVIGVSAGGRSAHLKVIGVEENSGIVYHTAATEVVDEVAHDIVEHRYTEVEAVIARSYDSLHLRVDDTVGKVRVGSGDEHKERFAPAELLLDFYFRQSKQISIVQAQCRYIECIGSPEVVYYFVEMESSKYTPRARKFGIADEENGAIIVLAKDVDYTRYIRVYGGVEYLIATDTKLCREARKRSIERPRSPRTTIIGVYVDRVPFVL